MTLLAITVSLFLIMDPLGNVPIFLALLSHFNQKKQRWIIFREMLIALAIMVFFLFLGEGILKLLHISQYAVQISGGIILFLIALQMIFPKNSSFNAKDSHGEPFIVPLAIPLVAGPSLLATLIIYSQGTYNNFKILLAVLIAWVFTTLILLASSWLSRVLGKRGLRACERMMGLILTLLAVQLFLEGVLTLINTQIT